jgi:beta-xylosidase
VRATPPGVTTDEPAWRDTSRPAAERVDDLLSRMTLAEKAGQLRSTWPGSTTPVTARQGAEALARIQREITAAGRFGIPAIAHDECLAGFTARWRDPARCARRCGSARKPRR